MYVHYNGEQLKRKLVQLIFLTLLPTPLLSILQTETRKMAQIMPFIVFATVAQMSVITTNAMSIAKDQRAIGSPEDFCKPTDFNMTVSLPGCKSKIIQNKFCYGQCFTTFFPASLKSKTVSCNTCSPVILKKQLVILSCPNNPEGFKVKAVRIIEDCKCQLKKCQTFPSSEWIKIFISICFQSTDFDKILWYSMINLLFARSW